MDKITSSRRSWDEIEPLGIEGGNASARVKGRVSSGTSKRKQFLSAPPHRRGDSHRLSILGDSAARNIDPIVLQKLDDTLIREGSVRVFAVNQGANSITNCLRRKRDDSIRCRLSRYTVILELLHP